MKTIEITVADDIVPTIVSLLVGECVEINIRPAGTERPGEMRSAPAGKRRRHHEETNLVDLVHEYIGTRTVSGSDLAAHFERRGFARNSAIKAAGRLIEQGKLERFGSRYNASYRRKAAA